MIDFSKLGKQSQSSSIEPRDIFMALPEKSEYYEYPRDVQSEVWKQWQGNRRNVRKPVTASWIKLVTLP